jgi:hypothetical protein
MMDVPAHIARERVAWMTPFVKREKWYQDAVGETPFQTTRANQSPT